MTRDDGRLSAGLRAQAGTAALGLALISQALFIEPVHAQTGGTGGATFPAQNCPTDQFMVGATGTTGWYVDEITVHCAPFGPNGLRAAFPTPLETVGAPGGPGYSQMCADGSVVTAISGTSGIYVDSIALTCTPVDGGAATTFAAAGGGGGMPYTLPSSPDPATAITGISGRSGWWIDRLNVTTSPICLPLPSDIAPTAPANNATATTLQPTFTWDDGFAETVGLTYEICISGPSENECSILRQSGISGTSFTPTEFIDFQGNDWVQWRVRPVGLCEADGEFTDPQILFAPAGGGVPATVASDDYRPLCSVYKDDRCARCHDNGQLPEDHDQEPTQACTFCHDETIHPVTNQPVWQLAPAQQHFAEGASCGDICRTVRDWAVDDAHDFIFHITQDPLIAWGFDPQQVLSNPVLPAVTAMNHALYASLSTSWARDGYPCNGVADDFPNAGDQVASLGGNGTNNGGDNGQRRPIDFKDPGQPNVAPPKIRPKAWWLDPNTPKPDLGKLLEQKGLPPECGPLVMGGQRLRQKEERRLSARRFGTEELLAQCKKLVKSGPSGR